LIYGPQTSTFQKKRKQCLLNIELRKELKKLKEVNPKTTLEVPEPLFYAWECVSVMRKNNCLSFIISDKKKLKIFLLSMSHLISKNNPKSQTLQSLSNLITSELFLFLRAKMMISYHALRKNVSVYELFNMAIVLAQQQNNKFNSRSRKLSVKTLYSQNIKDAFQKKKTLD